MMVCPGLLQDDDDDIDDDGDDDDDKDDETQNGHNSTNFEATTTRFFMVIDKNDTYRLYFLVKSQVYFANELMRTHLAYLF